MTADKHTQTDGQTDTLIAIHRFPIVGGVTTTTTGTIL